MGLYKSSGIFCVINCNRDSEYKARQWLARPRTEKKKVDWLKPSNVQTWNVTQHTLSLTTTQGNTQGGQVVYFLSILIISRWRFRHSTCFLSVDISTHKQQEISGVEFPWYSCLLCWAALSNNHSLFHLAKSINKSSLFKQERLTPSNTNHQCRKLTCSY